MGFLLARKCIKEWFSKTATTLVASLEGAILLSFVHLSTYLRYLPFIAIPLASAFIGLMVGFTVREFKLRMIAGFLTWVMALVFSLTILSSPVIVGVIEDPGPQNAWMVLMAREVISQAPFIFVSLVAGVVASGILKEE